MSSESCNYSMKDGILKVIIHHCENLKSNTLLSQPVLCMHVINGTSGTYVKKSDRNRAVVSFYENQRQDVDYIMPVMTQPCSLSGEKLTTLRWEEVFILNEQYDVFVEKHSNIILFFEIVDLIPVSLTKQQYERLNHNGMRKLAWAFLKVLGSNGAVNTGSKLRLQLYKSPKSVKAKKSSCVEVYTWWLNKHRISLDASLFITVQQYATFTVEPALRSMLPIQQEKGSTSFEKLTGFHKDSLSDFTDQSNSFSVDIQNAGVIWARKAGEACKIPVKIAELLNVVNCCQILKFSSFGRVLAVGCGAQDCYYLMLYQIPCGKLLHKMLAHSDLIYDLDWSSSDRYLLSASGDYNVKLWNTKCWSLVTSFVHPSFVYAAKFHPKLDNLIASACYDHIVRIWTLEKCQLLKELEAHNSSVCALCWNASGMKLYSADGIGQIKVWEKSQKVCGDIYCLKKEVNLVETKGISINKMELDPKEETLCLFCSDSIIRIFSLNNGKVLSSFESDGPHSKFSKGCCSPCGNLLFLCCDQGYISVWDRNLCDKSPENVLYNLNYGGPSCLEYHPFDHMFALSFWNDGVPVHLYVHEEIGKDGNEKNINTSDVKVPDTAEVGGSITTVCLDGKKENTLIEKVHILRLSSKCGNQLSKGLHFAGNSSNDSDMFDASISKTHKHVETSSEPLHAFHKEQQGNHRMESLTAVITKSGQFDVISVGDDTTHSDSSTFRNLNNDPVPSRNLKRSQRRKKLREMNKALL